MGEGICTTMVATQDSAASTAAVTMVLIFLSDIVSFSFCTGAV